MNNKQEPLPPVDHEKLNTGLYLIKLADSGMGCRAIEMAIADLKLTMEARKNIPF